jgi:hydroxymethylpyrimidine/phosphomethylpyrimidine kinase
VTTPVVALTIAGTDSAGGAGIHADLRTFAALGLHGASAIAALTAQDTRGITGVHVVPADFVVAQATAVLDDLEVRGTKTGFLASPDTVEAVAGLAAAGRLPGLVVDPVLVRATGERLFDRAVERSYLEHLLPSAVVATPNRVEAGLLVGRELRTTAAMAEAALELAATGPRLVVVKGGDADDEGKQSVDVAATCDGQVERLELPRIRTVNDHGSGCTFAAATAARLALGDAPLDAVRAAKAFVHAGLVGAAAWRLGAGHGPLDHFGWIRTDAPGGEPWRPY